MEKIVIGKIVSSVGLKGEVKVYSYTCEQRFGELNQLIVGEKAMKIEKVRYNKNMPILKLAAIDDRNSADLLKNKELYITEEQLPKLEDDEFFIKDLIGVSVINSDTEKEIGRLIDVLQNTAQDVYVVKTDSGNDILIPAVKEFVKSINLKEGIKIKVIPGLIDDEN